MQKEDVDGAASDYILNWKLLRILFISLFYH